MTVPSTTPSWQSVLQHIIRTPAERQRLAEALGVNVLTLNRWAKENSRPQRNHLIKLVQVILPPQRTELLEALRISYPDIDNWLHEESQEAIPSAFYAELLEDRATMIEATRNRQILEKILKQAIAQLDPNRDGLAITLVQCMPPGADGYVHSLRERIGRGTPPWLPDLEHLSVFLGMESLAGFVVQNQRAKSIDDLREDNLVPAYQHENEVSAAAAPILLEGAVAGCLLASSTQVGYFTQERLSLLASFADLATLGFNPSDFYQPSRIFLNVLHRADVQRPILQSFRKRVQQVFVDAARNHQHMTYAEAEDIVWRQIEEQLFAD